MDRSYLFASKYLDAHATYVGLSRHRDSADIFWSHDEFSLKKDLIYTLGRERNKDVTLDYLGRDEPILNTSDYLKDPHQLDISERKEKAEDPMAHLRAIPETKAFNETVEVLSTQYGKKYVEAVIGEFGVYCDKVEINKSLYAILERDQTICLVPYKLEMESLKGKEFQITAIRQSIEKRQLRKEVSFSVKDMDRDF